MIENKQVQTILRTTPNEKDKITNTARELGFSVNEFIKRTVLDKIQEIEYTKNNDSNYDSINDTISLLREQLAEKDKQIAEKDKQLDQQQQLTLEAISNNKLDKQLLLESSKHWWQFWK